MLSTFLCHIVPYGRPWAVLELHWHHGYLGRSRKGQKRTQRPFICFTLCVSLSPCPTETRTHTLTHTDFKHLEGLCISTLLCALHWCAHSVFMCGISMQTEPPLCVCAHWLRPRRCWHSLTDGAHRGFLYLLKNLHCNRHCCSSERPSELWAAASSLSTRFFFLFCLIHCLKPFPAL